MAAVALRRDEDDGEYLVTSAPRVPLWWNHSSLGVPKRDSALSWLDLVLPTDRHADIDAACWVRATWCTGFTRSPIALRPHAGYENVEDALSSRRFDIWLAPTGKPHPDARAPESSARYRKRPFTTSQTQTLGIS